MTSGHETVTLFCRPGCRKCKRVREWLDGRRLRVELVDPSVDENARTYLLERGFRGTPVVRTSDGRLAWGVDPDQLADALPILAAADSQDESE
jgi:glutaredoxin